MKPIPGISALLLVATIAWAEEPPHEPPSPAVTAESPATTMPATAAPRKIIEHDGETFELAHTTSSKNVDTDEYVVAGETIADWTQLLTVQRLTLAKPTATDEFLAYFQKRVQSEDGASLDILKQSKLASVFAVRFPKSDRNEEQVMICLAFSEPTNAAVLNIVQYAIKPTRSSVDLVEMRIRSWRDKFVHQAQTFAAK